jgi:hypothetical protein
MKSKALVLPTNPSRTSGWRSSSVTPGVEFTNKDVAEDEEAVVELERIPPPPPIALSHDLKMCRSYPERFLAVC